MRLAQACVFFALLLAGLFLAGCVVPDAGRMDQLRIGMSRTQAIAILGEPDHAVANGKEENMIYYLQAKGALRKRAYVVQLVDGQIRYFGQMLTMVISPAAESAGGAPAR